MCLHVCACMSGCVYVWVGVTMGGGAFHWWKFKYIQALDWEPTCQCTMSQRSFWWKGKGEEKETSGFGSKHWISFQAWTLHWAFQQMSKSLLAVDRQPNGPQHRECGRAMEEEEMETKGKHKGKMVYATFFFCYVQSIHCWRRLQKFMSLPRHFTPPFTLCFGSYCGFFFLFLCSALLLRHGRSDSWIGVQPQPSLSRWQTLEALGNAQKLEGWWWWVEGLLLAHISSPAVFWHERNKARN